MNFRLAHLITKEYHRVYRSTALQVIQGASLVEFGDRLVEHPLNGLSIFVVYPYLYESIEYESSLSIHILSIFYPYLSYSTNTWMVSNMW